MGWKWEMSSQPRELIACLSAVSLRLTGWKVPRKAAMQALTADVM